jgi:hypothetical protein
MSLNIIREKKQLTNGTKLDSLQTRIERIFDLYKINIFKDMTSLSQDEMEILTVVFMSKPQITLREIGEKFNHTGTWA